MSTSRPTGGDRLVILGTSGGSSTSIKATEPPSATNGTASALVVGTKIYVVDAGHSAARQLALADPLHRGAQRVMRDLTAVFLTHLHSDHTMDLVNFPLAGGDHNWPDSSVPVFGPWRRTISAHDYPHSHLTPDASLPAPGTVDFVDRLVSAYEADSLDRHLSGGRELLRSRLHGIDIVPPAGLESGHPAPDAPAWLVHEDDRVSVRATLVSHGTMRPALAYRFDTPAWSVVFSGDTSPSESLISLAQGADTLVHEAIDPEFARRVFGEPPHTTRERAAARRVLAKHTPATELGTIAQRAGVRRLVLNHLAPGNLPADYWRGLVTGYDGEIVVGDDLAVLDLP